MRKLFRAYSHLLIQAIKVLTSAVFPGNNLNPIGNPSLVVAKANTTCVVLNLKFLLNPNFLNTSSSIDAKCKVITYFAAELK